MSLVGRKKATKASPLSSSLSLSLSSSSLLLPTVPSLSTNSSHGTTASAVSGGVAGSSISSSSNIAASSITTTATAVPRTSSVPMVARRVRKRPGTLETLLNAATGGGGSSRNIIASSSGSNSGSGGTGTALTPSHYRLGSFGDRQQQLALQQQQQQQQLQPKTFLGRLLKNLLLPILVTSLPLCIFMRPMLFPSTTTPSSSNLQKKQQPPRVVVSLSTIPSRLALLEPSLNSLLLHQTQPPDAIYITLPQRKYYYYTNNDNNNNNKQQQSAPLFQNQELPTFLTKHLYSTDNNNNDNMIHILQPEWDYGPITKILYTLEKERHPDTRIIYLDDDVIYEPHLIQLLYEKSIQLPYATVAMSGAALQSHFRQIKHTHLKYNKPPNLFFQVSGTSSYILPNNNKNNQQQLGSHGNTDQYHTVDIVQGFMGVCVRRGLLTKIDSLFALLRQESKTSNKKNNNQQPMSLPEAVWKSDDFILSAWMTFQNITMYIIQGGSGTIQMHNASKIDNLSHQQMHNNAMDAAFYLQQYFNIWSEYQFIDRFTLSQQQRDAIDCEAAYEQDCSTNPKFCLPNPKSCPNAWALLESITTLDKH